MEWFLDHSVEWKSSVFIRGAIIDSHDEISTDILNVEKYHRLFVKGKSANRTVSVPVFYCRRYTPAIGGCSIFSKLYHAYSQANCRMPV